MTIVWENPKSPVSQPLALASLAWALSAPVSFPLFIASFLLTLSPLRPCCSGPSCLCLLHLCRHVHLLIASDDSSEQIAPSYLLSWGSAPPPLSLLSHTFPLHSPTRHFFPLSIYKMHGTRFNCLSQSSGNERCKGGHGGSTFCSPVIM